MKLKLWKNESGQAIIDYLSGMSIFLLTVIYVFQFMSGIFTPFYVGSEETTLATDRAITILVERVLAPDNNENINVVDETKLSDFMEKLNFSNKTEYYDALKQLGLYYENEYTHYKLNISVVNITDDSVLYLNGPIFPKYKDISQSERIVLIINSTTNQQKPAKISVRVW